MGHHRTDPDGQKTVLLRAKARDATEHRGHVVLTIPLRQGFQKLCDGIENGYLLRLHIHLDLGIGAAFLHDVFAFSPEDDAVQRFLRQRTPGSALTFRQGHEFYLSVEYVATETVIVV